jgi:hypothetical protein
MPLYSLPSYADLLRFMRVLFAKHFSHEHPPGILKEYNASVKAMAPDTMKVFFPIPIH